MPRASDRWNFLSHLGAHNLLQIQSLQVIRTEYSIKGSPVAIQEAISSQVQNKPRCVQNVGSNSQMLAMHQATYRPVDFGLHMALLGSLGPHGKQLRKEQDCSKEYIV